LKTYVKPPSEADCDGLVADAEKLAVVVAA